MLHRLDLVAGVPGIEVIHHIFQNDQHFVVLAEGVHTIVEGDEAAAEGGKHKIRVLASLDVVTAEARQVFAEYQIDLPVRRVLYQPVQPRTVKGCPAYAVITVVVIQRPALFPHIPGEHFLLIFD